MKQQTLFLILCVVKKHELCHVFCGRVFAIVGLSREKGSNPSPSAGRSVDVVSERPLAKMQVSRFAALGALGDCKKDSTLCVSAT